MRVYKAAIAAGIVAVVVLGSGCNPDKNKLYFKPQQGAKRTIDTEEAMNMSMSMMGMSMSFCSSMEYTFEMTTKSVDEAGNSTLDVEIKSLKSEITGLDGLFGAGGAGASGQTGMPGMPKGDDPLGMKSLQTAIKSAQGQTFTVKVSKLGEVLEVSGADAIAEKASAQYKAPAIARVTPKQALVTAIGDEAMKRTMEGIFNTRPDKKLNKGDSWQEKTTGGDAMMAMTQDATMTLKERSGGTVDVDLAAKMELSPAGDMLKNIGDAPGFKMEMSGQGTGAYKFDEATGWLVNGEATAKIPGSMSITAPQMGNMSIPMEASYKLSVKTYPS